MTLPMFFLDRGLGSRTVPERLRAAGWTVQTMDERYGRRRSQSAGWTVQTMDERYGRRRSQSVTDVEWIADIASADMVGVSKDRNIGRVGIEVDAVVTSESRVLLLPRANLRGLDMANRLVPQQRGIFRLALQRPGPWIVVVQRQALEPLDLDR